MSPLGRISAKHEEELLLKQDAAEELYEVLKRINNCEGTQLPWQILHDMHAVLAKAEGR